MRRKWPVIGDAGRVCRNGRRFQLQRDQLHWHQFPARSMEDRRYLERQLHRGGQDDQDIEATATGDIALTGDRRPGKYPCAGWNIDAYKVNST